MPLAQDLKYITESGCQALTSGSDLQGKLAPQCHNLFIAFALSKKKWIVLDNSGHVPRTANDKLRQSRPSAEPQCS